MIARYQSSLEFEVLELPGWTGFYYGVIKNDELVTLDVVHYLPAIDGYHKRNVFQVKEKAEAIWLKETDLVLEHAIYSR